MLTILLLLYGFLSESIKIYLAKTEKIKKEIKFIDNKIIEDNCSSNTLVSQVIILCREYKDKKQKLNLSYPSLLLILKELSIRLFSSFIKEIGWTPLIKLGATFLFYMLIMKFV